MDTRLYAKRVLPNGEECYVRPFHVSLEGLESALICRDEEDYDVMTKYICTCAHKANVIIVIYTVVSNHAHIGVLAASRPDVEHFVNELKKVQSMWIRRKYGDMHILKDTDNCISEIETLSYARNALAYIPRNALDNGAKNVSEYKWSGYRAMFSTSNSNRDWIPVRHLTARQNRSVLHTFMKVKNMPWMLNRDMEIEPSSFCDNEYLERIFNNDQSFFLKTIGGIVSTEIGFHLSEASMRKNTDSEFFRLAQECSRKWFNADVVSLSLPEKAKLIHFLQKKWRMTIPQTARCLKMERNLVAKLFGKAENDV